MTIIFRWACQENMESSSNDEEDAEESGDTTDSGEHRAQMEEDVREHNTLWHHEGELRYRTPGLTNMERKHLAGIDEAMATRLLNSMNLGEPMPVAAVWLNHLLNQEARTYEKGESLRFPTASWSLAKCQLVQRRLQASRPLVNC